jgi:hypothetical protein
MNKYKLFINNKFRLKFNQIRYFLFFYNYIMLHCQTYEM